MCTQLRNNTAKSLVQFAHFAPVVTSCKMVVQYPGQVLTLKQFVLYLCIGSIHFYVVI